MMTNLLNINEDLVILCCFSEDRRALTEPPVPGYCGYIPRIKTTEQGLGARYHMSTRNGLELFAQETASASQRLTGQLPASLDRSVQPQRNRLSQGIVGILRTNGTQMHSQHLYIYWLFFVVVSVPDRVLQGTKSASTRRLYLTDGMIPKYTGYVPRKSCFFVPFCLCCKKSLRFPYPVHLNISFYSSLYFYRVRMFLFLFSLSLLHVYFIWHFFL